MEPEDSVQRSQETATSTCLETVEFIYTLANYFYKMQFNIPLPPTLVSSK